MAGLTHEGTAFVFLWVCEESRFPPSPPPLHPHLFLFPPLSLSLSSLLSLRSVLLFSRWSVSVASCAESELLGVSRVVCSVSVAFCVSHRVVRSLASSPRLSSRVVCRSHRVMRSLVTSQSRPRLVLSSRLVCRRVVRSLASSRRLSSRVVFRLVVHRPAARCQSRRVSESGVACPLSVVCVVRQSPLSSGVSRVIASSVVSRRQSSSRRASSRCSASVGLCARRVSRVPFSFLFRLDG